MKSYKQFLENENKNKVNTNKVDAVTDIAKALQKICKDYTLETRKYAWKKITSTKGEKLVQELLRTPSRSLSPFRTLVP